MAIQDKYIPSGQRTTIDNGQISIYVFYQPEGYLDLRFFVPILDTIREGISFTGGELGYTYADITASFEVNTLGDLIVNDIDPSLYSINAAGDLILIIT